MKLYLFLRSIIWTSVFSVLLLVASLVSAFLDSNLAVPLGLGSIALAVLSSKRNG